MMKTKSNNISVKPVKKYSPPKYPDFAQSKLNPELLKKLPERWQSNKKILLGLSLLGTISLASCNLIGTRVDSKIEAFLQEKMEEEYVYSRLAGLVLPTIMSEQDALEIIRKEMSENGIKLNYSELFNENESEREKIDLISESGNIGISYVNDVNQYVYSSDPDDKLKFSAENKNSTSIGVFEYITNEEYVSIYTNEEEIKARVRDFIEWLQGQGII